jgi:hypothetical protein
MPTLAAKPVIPFAVGQTVWVLLREEKQANLEQATLVSEAAGRCVVEFHMSKKRAEVSLGDLFASFQQAWTSEAERQASFA